MINIHKLLVLVKLLILQKGKDIKWEYNLFFTKSRLASLQSAAEQTHCLWLFQNVHFVFLGNQRK